MYLAKSIISLAGAPKQILVARYSYLPILRYPQYLGHYASYDRVVLTTVGTPTRSLRCRARSRHDATHHITDTTRSRPPRPASMLMPAFTLVLNPERSESSVVYEVGLSRAPMTEFARDLISFSPV